jgi:hypothetical protein
MSSFKCLACEWINQYHPGSPEVRRLFEVFDGIWYCEHCCEKYQIEIDVNGDKINKDK